MSIIHVHTVIAIAVDTETGKVLCPPWDAGTDMLYDGAYIYEPERGDWAQPRGPEPKLTAALDAAAEAFSALLATQGD